MIARSVSIARIARTTILLTIVLAVLCAIAGRGDAASVAFGGAVSLVNLYLIRMIVSRLMSPDAAGPPLSRVVATKFLVLLALLAIALKRLPIDAASFLIGGGSLFLAIVLDAVLLGEPVQATDDGAGSS